jgi:hypothetical protein
VDTSEATAAASDVRGYTVGKQSGAAGAAARGADVRGYTVGIQSGAAAAAAGALPATAHAATPPAAAVFFSSFFLLAPWFRGEGFRS